MSVERPILPNDKLGKLLFAAAVNANGMQEKDLREIAKTDPDPKHKHMVEESIRAKKSKQN